MFSPLFTVDSKDFVRPVACFFWVKIQRGEATNDKFSYFHFQVPVLNFLFLTNFYIYSLHKYTYLLLATYIKSKVTDLFYSLLLEMELFE